VHQHPVDGHLRAGVAAHLRVDRDRAVELLLRDLRLGQPEARGARIQRAARRVDDFLKPLFRLAVAAERRQDRCRVIPGGDAGWRGRVLVGGVDELRERGLELGLR
jgi:hypothetical protein